jgi:FkbM family methyltransferase
MQTECRTKARILDGAMALCETVVGRGRLNRLCGYVYWRTRGENLDDPDRNGEYRCLEAVVRSILGDQPFALDVGGNIGDWTALFLEKAPTGRVCVFEPVAGTYASLAGRFANDSRVQCVNAAVSAEPGTCVLRVSRDLSGSNSIYRMPDEIGVTEQSVVAITGDEFVLKAGGDTVAYLKIDVEGHEFNVLRGCRNLISAQQIRFIQWEYNKTWLPARASLMDVFGMLVPAGYKLCKMRKDNVLHYPMYQRHLDNYCYSNWIAVRAADFSKFKAVVCVLEDTGTDW